MITKLTIKKHIISPFAAGVIMTSCCTAQSIASLTVNVTGDANGSGSTWVFNGTTEVHATAPLSGLGANTNINFYTHATELSGDYVSDANYDNISSIGHSILGGSVSGSISGVFTFDGLFIDSDSVGLGSDDFAWLIGTQPFHDFSDGEILTFSNYTLFTGFDITTFGEGADAITVNGDKFKVDSSSEAAGDLALRFEAVPEPTSGLLLMLGLSSVVVRRVRS